MHEATADTRWHGLYKGGGIAAFAVAVLLLGEILVYALLPRASTAGEHFAIFRDHWMYGLLSLDLLGMVCYLLFVPAMLGLCISLRQAKPALTLVATVLFFIGIADFYATNTAFPMLDLSTRLAAASTAEERSLLMAAGQAMMTLFNENAFLVSYVIVSAAWAMLGGAMLKSKVFGKGTALLGMFAGGAGIAAVVLEHAVGTGTTLAVAIALYFAAIVFLLAWVILLGRRLCQLGRPAPGVLVE